MFEPNGLRASELVARLAELIDLHGDCRVVICGDDYHPYDCEGVDYQAEERGYYHADTFIVH